MKRNNHVKLGSRVCMSGIVASKDNESGIVIMQIGENTFIEIMGGNNGIQEQMLNTPLYSFVSVVGRIGQRETQRKIVMNYVIADRLKTHC